MRTFLAFFLLLASALILAAALTWPAWLLVIELTEAGLFERLPPFHRVMHRIAMLIALIGFIVIARRMSLANRAALGYGMPRRRFFAQMGLGFVAGAVMMVPLIATLIGLELRVPRPGYEWGGGELLGAISQGLASGIAVALIEETFFRGALQTGIERESGRRAAIALPSLLYASLHFLGGKLKVPEDWSSGFEVLARLFERYIDPLALADSFAALVAVGILLALVRVRTGAIAACLGLHAAWVCVIAVLREATSLDPHADAAWLVGSYDGVIGWGALGWMAALVLAYSMLGARRPAADPR